MYRELYGIVDNLAEDLVGPVITCRNKAEAVRLFTDLLSNPNTSVGLHPKDHHLLFFGLVTDNPATPEGDHAWRVNGQVGVLVLSGEQWLASQPTEG